MKPKFYEQVPESFLSGKLPLILIIILCSSASFLLGYFVGRTRVDDSGIKTAYVTGEDNSPVPEAPGPDFTGNIQPKEMEPETSGQDYGKSRNKPLPDESLLNAAATKEALLKEATSAPVKKPVKKKETKTNKKDKRKVPGHKTVTVKKKVSKKKILKISYTIQVGAFGNYRDAEKLKDRLALKGYKVSIVKGGKKRILYRVRIGHYGKRKDAEVAAIRITRSEGLKTFILRERV